MASNIVDYGPEIEAAIDELAEAIDRTSLADIYPSRWLAIALLDSAGGLDDTVMEARDGRDILDLRASLIGKLEWADSTSLELVIAGKRFDRAHEAAAIAMNESPVPGTTLTDRIDDVITNRFLGIPIFLGLMWLVFLLTTDVAGILLDWVDGIISGPVSDFGIWLTDAIGLGGTWIQSMVVDGAIAGVGAIVVFVPILLILYLALSFLEDTGYMARAAFVMDRFMRSVGLQGKSFLPMLVGFGCTVPAVYATRTLDNERDRIVTALIAPFMSCGARLPVYVLMGSIFFPGNAGTVTFIMYLLGIVVALILGLVLRGTVLPTTSTGPTIMEMPQYRMPTVRTITLHTWTRTKAFLKEAGTVIFATMMAVWLLMAIPTSGDGSFADTDVNDSAFATIADVASPIFEPAGFGTWEATGSLMTGFVAKEVVIGTMAQAYGGDEEDESTLYEPIRESFEESSDGHAALAAFAFMVFVLLYTPCMAAVGAIRGEIGSRWMWFSIINQFAIAWTGAVLVFQVGKFIVG